MSIKFEKNNKNFINFQDLDGYNKTFNLIMCPREAGKTAQIEYIKLYKTIINNRGSVIILKRYANEVSQNSIDTIIKRINRYLNADQKISCKNVKGLLSGVGTFNIEQNKKIYKNEIMIIWLGRIQKLKNTCIENVKYILFDEYCVNPKSEKYQPEEFNSIIELYKTITRYTDKKIKFYFCGNPYSKFNPFTDYFKVPFEKMKPHRFILGPEWCVWCYQLTKEKIERLKKDPIYNYDDEYANFALEGSYLIDDKYKRLIVKTHQPHSRLCYYIYYNNNLYGIFNNNNFFYFDLLKCILKKSKHKIYTLNPLDNCLNENYEMIDENIRYRFRHLKNALKMNYIAFNSITAFLMLCEIYPQL